MTPTTTQTETRALSRRLAAAVRTVPVGWIAVVAMRPGLRYVVEGEHPDFDAAEQHADQLRAELAATGRPATARSGPPLFLLRPDGGGTATIFRDRDHQIGPLRTMRQPLPPADKAANARLAALRIEQMEISRKLAHAELAAAAYIIVELFGAHAAQLLVAKDETDSGDTTIVPLLLFDNDHNLLWFNPDDHYYDIRDYPGTEDIQTTNGRPVHDVDETVTEAITAHLEAAYDAVGGCGHALDHDVDDHLGTEINVLVFDIAAALLPWHLVPDPGVGR